MIALLRLTPGMVIRNWIAISKSESEEIRDSIMESTSLISSSRRLKTGTHYLPVDSMQTLWQSFWRSHCLNSRIELLKVENASFDKKVQSHQ